MYFIRIKRQSKLVLVLCCPWEFPVPQQRQDNSRYTPNGVNVPRLVLSDPRHPANQSILRVSLGGRWRLLQIPGGLGVGVIIHMALPTATLSA